MLEQIAHFNDLSPKLRDELEHKINSYGKKVRYKFDVSHDNPDPTAYNGKVVWPFMYTLDPVTFRITDKYEDRKDKQKVKLIALINKVNDKGIPESFYRIRILERHKGVIPFDLTSQDDRDMVMYLELHPKLQGGVFADSTKHQMFYRIDEQKLAKENRENRDARNFALNVAKKMSDQEVKDFADAMLWEETNEIDLLRDRVEAMAETSPPMFNDLVSGKNIEYQAAIKRAVDKEVISYDPAENKFIWSNKQTLTVLNGGVNGKNEVERLAEWLMTGGKKSDEVYNKIKSLIKV